MTKINYIKGDLFKTSERVIVHGCNNKGYYGAGVSGIVTKLYPKATKEYVKYCNTHQIIGGELIPVYIKSCDKVIINAITQDNVGIEKRRANYEWIAKVFNSLNELLPLNDIHSFAAPKIGSALGGGDWNVIAAIIESECKNIQPHIYYL